MKAIHVASTVLRPVGALLTAILLAIILPGTSVEAKPPPRPDLVVNDLKLREADGGSKLDIKFQVKNQGEADAEAVLVAISVGPYSQQTRQIDKLKTGKSKDFELKVDYPNSSNPQERFVRVFADPNNTISESDDNNNQALAYFDVSSATLPDLVIDKIQIEQTKVTPPEVKVTVRVKNKGKADSPDFDLSVWQPENPNLQSKYVLVGLKHGESREVSLLSGPIGTDPATYMAQVDPVNKIHEANEDNNSATEKKKLHVDSKLPDLLVQITRIELTNNNATLSISYSVRNQGTDVSTPIEVALKQEQGYFVGGAELTNGLKKGASNDTTRIFQMPADPTEVYGTRITVTVDPTNLVSESNENNNVAVATIPDPRNKVFPVPTIGPAAPAKQF